MLKLLNEGVENSNQILFASSNDILISIQNKLADPGVERAKYWYPKAEKIQKLSKEAFDFIENLKAEVDKKPIKKAFEKLVDYQNRVLLVDSQIAYVFRNSVSLITKEIDSSRKDQQGLSQNYFNDASNVSQMAILSKLQNNIRINEERILTFCHEQVGKIVLGPCSPDLPIVVQNSTIVLPGEKIEIIAGICSFYFKTKPEIFVYQKLIPIGSEGVAISKFKAELKPGRYHVPVKVNYTDQDGRKQSVQKEIEYTVANIQQQE